MDFKFPIGGVHLDMKILALLILVLLFYLVKAIIVGVSEGGKVLLHGINEAEKRVLNKNNLQSHTAQTSAAHPNSPLLLPNNSAPYPETSFDIYCKLADKYLSKNALNHKTITKIAIHKLDSGQTPEQTLIYSYFLDIALTANDARDNPNINEMIGIATSIMPMLAVFKEWKDAKRVEEDVWAKMTTLIYHASTPSPEQDAAIKCAIEELRYFESGSTQPNQKNDSCQDEKDQYLHLAYKIHEVLKAQFDYLRKHERLSITLGCEFALGYIIGLSDYFLQNWHKTHNLPTSEEVSAKEMAAVAIVFMIIYGQELGSALFGKCLRDLEGKSDEFYNGKLAGNRDFLSFSNRNAIPVGLQEYIETMNQT